MTDSESKFRNYLTKKWKGCCYYLKKLPDKKQCGTSGSIGLPDYLFIHDGKTLWYEVKLSHTKTTFPLSDIRDSQMIEFRKMVMSGAEIYFAIYVSNILYIIDYKLIAPLKEKGDVKSVDINQLQKWSVV